MLLTDTWHASLESPGYLSLAVTEGLSRNLRVTILALKEIPGDTREWLHMNKN